MEVWKTIDGNKLNNDTNNLEWATCKENINHFWKNIGRETRGENHNHSKFKNIDIKLIRFLDTKLTRKDIGFMFNSPHQTISGIIQRRNWGHI